MARYRLTVEYDGRPYCGFQAQKDLPSVQASLARAIEAFSGERPVIHGAGRTDAGVHATGQVIHFETDRDWPALTVQNALNAHLGAEPIAVLDAVLAEPDFHARFSAKGRRYQYRILNRRAPPALDGGRVWHVKRPLDVEAMHRAAQRLIGLHDFTTFRDALCQAKSPLKTLDLATVGREGEERCGCNSPPGPSCTVRVRSMTGSLVEVGLGRWSEDDLKAALDAADRSACGPVAPAEGLYLAGVEY